MKLKVTHPELASLIVLLNKKSNETKTKIWRDVASRLNRSRRLRVAINISRINRYTNDGDVIIVPGKVLGAGSIGHPITVAALDFSNQAKDKIIKAGGNCLTIRDLIAENPGGKGIKIIG